MSTGPPVSSTIAVRRIGARDSLDKAVLLARQIEALGVGAFGHILIDEKDDRVGLSRRLRRSLWRRPIVEVHPGARKLAADRLERRTRVENHGPVLADLFLRGDSSARNDLRRAAAGRHAQVGVSSNHEESPRVGRERQQALVPQQNHAFARNGERGPIARIEIDSLGARCLIGEAMREDRGREFAAPYR